ncbi:LysR family transcriptional regulator [Leisingera sp. McT4-56]|uniref:LysR family transcriptional regulator n=1 Tax=Leisingera sp. McT4-56 TaxID=2881255 RepID=UPI001CF865C6|nr:LysR family transcriptional regulator [Leisingera sp. McT4-56]MCB4458396.1 LysR family transcriptional regulator [Leisingera sp. McT4-56]
MIDDLRAMAIFATVAETGSFSAAGRRLRLATSGISQHVTKLEDRLGITLFYRSTRSLSLTSEGKRLLEHTQRMVAAAEDGLNSVVDISNEPAGALTITLPAFMAGSSYERAIWDFAFQHRAVALTVRYLDRNFDLVAEGIDLALRVGDLPDSNLRSRRLGSAGRKLVCAPSYLATLSGVTTPDDLKTADFVAMEGLIDQVVLTKGEDQRTLHTNRGRVVVDSFAALRSALCAGLGIQRLPALVADPELENGTLAEVLPDWSIPDLGTYGVWPGTSRRRSLSRLLIDHIVAWT